MRFERVEDARQTHACREREHLGWICVHRKAIQTIPSERLHALTSCVLRFDIDPGRVRTWEYDAKGDALPRISLKIVTAQRCAENMHGLVTRRPNFCAPFRSAVPSREGIMRDGGVEVHCENKAESQLGVVHSVTRWRCGDHE